MAGVCFKERLKSVSGCPPNPAPPLPPPPVSVAPLHLFLTRPLLPLDPEDTLFPASVAPQPPSEFTSGDEGERGGAVAFERSEALGEGGGLQKFTLFLKGN